MPHHVNLLRHKKCREIDLKRIRVKVTCEYLRFDYTQTVNDVRQKLVLDQI